MVFGFGPALLVERGWDLQAASGATSVVLWIVALSLPIGGFLADRLDRRDTVMVFGFLAFATLLALTPSVETVLPLFVLMGLVGGLSAGPIMSLPAAVLVPGNRAFGMGVYFTLFYAGVVFAPIGAGWLSERAGSSAMAFYFGTAMLAACIFGLVVFNRLARTDQGPR